MCSRKGKQTHRGELIKLSKQFIQQFNQFLGCALGGQAGETHYICKQDAATEIETERERERGREKKEELLEA